jgi:hypothetical protein
MENIYIAQYYTNNLTHGPFAEAINKKYADEQGYGYYCEKSTENIREFLNGCAPTWYKPKLILDIFNNFNPEYILFLDTDAIISDTKIRIEEFIDPNYYFIAAEDMSHHSIMNAGVFLIKNNEWSRDFLEEWSKCSKNLKPIDCTYKSDTTEHDLNTPGFYYDRLWMDQTALSYLYYDRKEFKDKIKVISNRSFNWYKYNEDNFIFHAYAYGYLPNRTIDLIHTEIFK